MRACLLGLCAEGSRAAALSALSFGPDAICRGEGEAFKGVCLGFGLHFLSLMENSGRGECHQGITRNAYTSVCVHCFSQLFMCLAVLPLSLPLEYLALPLVFPL